MKNKINEFTAFVGIDWADCKHDISIVLGYDAVDRTFYDAIGHNRNMIAGNLGNP